jgi:hypothetical protein
MSLRTKFLMLSSALCLGAAPLMAQEDYEDAPYDSPVEAAPQEIKKVPLRLEPIGRDMLDLVPEARLSELRAIAKTTLAEGRPLVFRDIVVAFFDPHWSELDRGNTALALIGWLPDTAEFLRPRIHATTIAIEEGELDHEERAMLWRDLLARVERVGDPRLTDDLLIAMMRSGASDHLTKTISRLFDTENERLDTLITLLHDHGREASTDLQNIILAEIDELTKDRLVQRHDPNRLAVALFRTGHIERANMLVAQEQDPVLRMRTRVTFLLDDPDYLAERSPETAMDSLRDERFTYPKIGPQ